MNHHARVNHQVEGHALALAVAGLVLFGVAPKFDDHDRINKLSDAVVVTNNAWMIGLLNESVAITNGIQKLEALDEADAKEHFMHAVVHAAGAFLEEYGGLTGLRRCRTNILTNANAAVLDALHGRGAAVGETPPTEAAPTAAGLEATVVHVDLSGDVKAQLKSAGLPDELAAVLARIGN